MHCVKLLPKPFVKWNSLPNTWVAPFCWADGMANAKAQAAQPENHSWKTSALSGCKTRWFGDMMRQVGPELSWLDTGCSGMEDGDEVCALRNWETRIHACLWGSRGWESQGLTGQEKLTKGILLWASPTAQSIKKERQIEPSSNNSEVIQDRIKNLLSSVNGKICQLEKPLPLVTRSSLMRCSIRPAMCL